MRRCDSELGFFWVGVYVEGLVGGDLEGEAKVELVGVGGGGQEKVVGEAGEVLGGGWGDSGDASGEPGLRGDGDFGAACGDGGVDLVGGMTN